VRGALAEPTSDSAKRGAMKLELFELVLLAQSVARLSELGPQAQGILCRAAGSIDFGPGSGSPRTAADATTPNRSAQAVLHVLRSDGQQISAQPSERNASWMSARLS